MGSVIQVGNSRCSLEPQPLQAKVDTSSVYLVQIAVRFYRYRILGLPLFVGLESGGWICSIVGTRQPALNRHQSPITSSPRFFFLAGVTLAFKTAFNRCSSGLRFFATWCWRLCSIINNSFELCQTKLSIVPLAATGLTSYANLYCERSCYSSN